LSYAFLKAADDAHAFDTNPLYAVAHESIYCNGGEVASDWAAERALRDFNDQNGGVFDATKALSSESSDDTDTANKIYFTGEMVFPFMFDEFARLRSLKGIAYALGRKNRLAAVVLRRRSERKRRAGGVRFVRRGRVRGLGLSERDGGGDSRRARLGHQRVHALRRARRRRSNSAKTFGVGQRRRPAEVT